MNMPPPFALFAAVFMLSGNVAAAESITFESGPTQTRLIELYTSEGCSSCPPADRWFSELADDDGLWDDYVPVAFHVTYWNYLGWRDAFSQAQFDQRQRRRAAAAGSGVYTPGVFLDGDEFRSWRRLSSAPTTNDTARAGELRVEVRDGQIATTYLTDNADESFAIEVAVLSNGLTSKVRAGENRGRSLRHDFVVASIEGEAMARAEEGWQATLALPSIEGVDKPALAVWVLDEQGEPVQATGGWLN